MLIFSSFNTTQKFKEISDFSECDSISSDIIVFFRLSNTQSLESYFLLAKKLSENDVKYAVLLPSSEISGCQYIKSAMLMFADFKALFFIIERSDGNFIKGRHDDLLASLQNIVNFYLLDMKLLALVPSFYAIEELSNMRLPNDSMDDSDSRIGLDGIIENEVLFGKKD